MKTPTPAILALSLTLLLSACGGGNNPVPSTVSSIGSSPQEGTLISPSDIAIVHVDEIARIVTFRNGSDFTDGAFLIVKDRYGKRSAVLKVHGRRESGLRTADILEGEPQINYLISKASSAESTRLSGIYPDAEEE